MLTSTSELHIENRASMKLHKINVGFFVCALLIAPHSNDDTLTCSIERDEPNKYRMAIGIV